MNTEIKCSICESVFKNQDFAKHYHGIVCRKCESKAVNSFDSFPTHDSWKDNGDNPIYINGIKCKRRYRFGGYITMLDIKKS